MLTLNNKAVWRIPVQVVQVDPVTQSRTPFDFTGSALEVEFETEAGTVVGAASTAAGTITLTDAPNGRFIIVLPPSSRPAVAVPQSVTIIGDVYRRVGGGEPEWLNRLAATLLPGT